ncbi:MAG: hypothetical protein BM555_04670 [Crocinitomix sp. MedPE-SWsnd]|nr:MAG: hypothetical protein BM555_04670 [Crocinitomix sp. MedPE-SWsnd]
MLSEVQKTQQILLKLLIFFDEVCRKHQIDYWIDGGTFLGAVRHGGFIPWDDDIDVCILQKDFDRAISVFEEEVKTTDNYFLYNSCRAFPHYTEYLADNSFLKSSNKLPVQIDLVRVKELENSREAIALDDRMVNVLKYYVLKPFDKTINTGQPEEKFLRDPKFRSRKNFYAHFINDYLGHLKGIDQNKVYAYCYNDCYINRPREHYLPSEIFPLSTIEFEGHEFRCPGDSVAYLTKLYNSSYMQPPPEELQKPSTTRSIKNVLSRGLTKKWVYFIYALKEMKHKWKLKKVKI